MPPRRPDACSRFGYEPGTHWLLLNELTRVFPGMDRDLDDYMLVRLVSRYDEHGRVEFQVNFVKGHVVPDFVIIAPKDPDRVLWTGAGRSCSTSNPAAVAAATAARARAFRQAASGVRECSRSPRRRSDSEE